MVLTVKPLVPLHCVLQLELDLGVIGRELEADFVDQLGGEGEVGPALEVLVALVLKPVLPSSVELHHLKAHIGWQTLIPHILEHRSVEIVREKSEGLWPRRGRDLLQKVVSEGILNTGVLEEDGIGSQVEHPIVTLGCAQRRWRS